MTFNRDQHPDILYFRFLATWPPKLHYPPFYFLSLFGQRMPFIKLDFRRDHQLTIKQSHLRYLIFNNVVVCYIRKWHCKHVHAWFMTCNWWTSQYVLPTALKLSFPWQLSRYEYANEFSKIQNFVMENSMTYSMLYFS